VDGSPAGIALISRNRRHKLTFWLKYMLKKRSIIKGLLLIIKMLIYLKKVNMSKVKDVEQLSVQGNNSGDTLIVNGVKAGMVAAMNILANS